MKPFIYGKVVSGDNFYDRTEECKRIVNTLAGGNNLVLYSPRRYGKTSLVFRAVQELEELGYICIYLDFMMVYSRESFINQYSQAIMQKQNNLSKAVAYISTLLKGISPVISYGDDAKPEFSIRFNEAKLTDATLEEIIDLPENLSTKDKKYIIVMDEFQEITKLNGENFEKLLRSKIQRQNNVNYIFLGSRYHLLQDMFSNRNRAFYNSALTMQLDKLPISASIEYLQKRFSINNITISEHNANYLLDKVDNIPYYIQLLASEIWQSLIVAPKEISKEIIDTCADNIVDLKNDYYYALFESHSTYQKQLLKALAKSGLNVFSKEYQLKNRLSAVSTTQKAIQSMIDSAIIDKFENEYYISDPFFKKFVQRYL